MPDAPTTATTTTPPRAVVVVGAGLAGLAAALEAVDALKETATETPPPPPPPVLVLEGQARTGGNSAKASSGVSAVAAAGDAAAIAAFEADLVASATATVGVDGAPGVASASPRRAAALRTLAAASPGALAWLASASGVDLTSRPPARLGGHGVTRTYGPPGGAPVGAAVMGGLAKAVETQKDWVEVRTGARVVGLVVAGADGRERVVGPGDEEGASGGVTRVVGVAVDAGREESPPTTIRAAAVVLATGGFGASPALLAAHAPSAAGLPTTNGPWAAGEGLRLGEAAGGATADMGLVQVHPTAFLPLGEDGGSGSGAAGASVFLAPERLRGVGGLLLNVRGERFADELARRDALAAAVRAQPGGGVAWLVLSADAVEAYGASAIAFYESKGLMSRVDGGVAALAAAMGAPEAAVSAALADHDASVSAGAPDAVGRASHSAGAFGTAGPFHIGRVGPAVHYTMGGLATDGSCRVVGAGGDEPIPGLFAAGEVTGGVHGANRLGGCSLLECVVFGRTAGRAAVEAGRGGV
jgi:flavocytochrome c